MNEAPSEQRQIVFDEGKGLATQEQAYDPTPIINDLRDGGRRLFFASADPDHIQFPMTGWNFIRRIQDRMFEERIGH